VDLEEFLGGWVYVDEVGQQPQQVAQRLLRVEVLGVVDGDGRRVERSRGLEEALESLEFGWEGG
jgi:hypothetical protein